jgi:hypothetical protein
MDLSPAMNVSSAQSPDDGCGMRHISCLGTLEGLGERALEDAAAIAMGAEPRQDRFQIQKPAERAWNKVFRATGHGQTSNNYDTRPCGSRPRNKKPGRPEKCGHYIFITLWLPKLPRAVVFVGRPASDWGKVHLLP